MPHPDAEHGLRVQLATAMRERDAALAQETYWHNRATEARDELAAARRECEALRAALDTIRRGGGGMDPLGRMEMSRIARDALAAPADGEEGK